MSNRSKRLSGDGLHFNEDDVSKLCWGQTSYVSFNVGAVEKFDNQLIEDISLPHVIVFELVAEVGVTVADPRYHLSLFERTFKTGGNQFLQILYFLFLFFDRLAFCIELYRLGLVSLVSFPLAENNTAVGLNH